MSCGASALQPEDPSSLRVQRWTGSSQVSQPSLGTCSRASCFQVLLVFDTQGPQTAVLSVSPGCDRCAVSLPRVFSGSQRGDDGQGAAQES